MSCVAQVLRQIEHEELPGKGNTARFKRTRSGTQHIPCNASCFSTERHVGTCFIRRCSTLSLQDIPPLSTLSVVRSPYIDFVPSKLICEDHSPAHFTSPHYTECPLHLLNLSIPIILQGAYNSETCFNPLSNVRLLRQPLFTFVVNRFCELSPRRIGSLTYWLRHVSSHLPHSFLLLNHPLNTLPISFLQPLHTHNTIPLSALDYIHCTYTYFKYNLDLTPFRLHWYRCKPYIQSSTAVRPDTNLITSFTCNLANTVILQRSYIQPRPNLLSLSTLRWT